MKPILVLLVVLAIAVLLLAVLPMLQSSTPEEDAARLAQVQAEVQARIAQAQARQAEAPTREFLWTLAGAILVIGLAMAVLGGGIALLQVATRGVWLYWEAFMSGLAVSRMAAAPEVHALPAPEPWRGQVLPPGGGVVLPIGKTYEGKLVSVPIDGDTQGLLVAGQSGWGKSSLLRAQMVALAGQKAQVAVVNPKRVDLAVPPDSRMLFAPVAVSEIETGKLLASLVQELDRRYEDMHSQGTDLWTQVGIETLVLFIDELSVVMSAADSEMRNYLFRLLRTGRAAGLFVVAATQRPTAATISGEVRANMAHRVCLPVASTLESRVVIDSGEGAALPKEKGAALYQHGEIIPVRTDWIDGENYRRQMNATRTGRLAVPLATMAAQVAKEETRDEKIEALLRQGMTQSEVEVKVFGHAGGNASRQVKAVKERML